MRARVLGGQFHGARQAIKRHCVVVAFVSNHAEVIPSVCLLRVEPQCLFEVSLRFRKIPFEEQRPAQRKLAAGIVWSIQRNAGSTAALRDRKSTRLNSSHGYISYAVFCLKKKNNS